MNKTRLIIALSTAALGSSYLYYRAVLPAKNLDRFLAAVREVEVGKTKLSDFNATMQQKGLSNLAFPCRDTTCGYSLQLQNTVLHRLRLAPHTIAFAEIAFEKGIASEIHIVLELKGRDRDGSEYREKTVVVRQTSSVGTPCPSRYNLTLKSRDSAGTISDASLGMDACVSQEDRQKALDINADCLSRIGGCKDVKMFLPQVSLDR